MDESADGGRVGVIEGPVVLVPRFQHYEWGDPTFIPNLLGLPKTDKPYAEAWIGAHPQLPAIARVAGSEMPLDRLVTQYAESILGHDIRTHFGELPYLVKVIATAHPLSIQVHPTRALALAGFERESADGIALDAPERSFRDKNAKPELLIALTEFEALCGFRPLPEIGAVLAQTPELAAVLPTWNGTPDSLKALVCCYLRLPDEHLLPALSQWIDRLGRKVPERGTREHWILEYDRLFSAPHGRDRGLFLLCLLNLVRLKPWQAIFIPCGSPHSYLRGAGIEVMANSDNVVRAGLTPKHVDREQLLTLLEFDGSLVSVLRPERGAGSWSYPCPHAEFMVRRMDLQAGQESPLLSACGPEVLLFLCQQPGETCSVRAGSAGIELGNGASCLMPHGLRYRLAARAPTNVIRVSTKC